MQEIIGALDVAGKDRAVKVVVMRALGPAFSSGHDLREMRCAGDESDVAAFREIFDVCVQMMEKVQSIPQPVIAEVLAALRGHAGCSLARMSGSGATCFGLFTTATAASKAANLLRNKHPAWWVEPTTLGEG